MKKLTLSLLVGSALLTQSVFAAQENRAISYLTSWGIPAQAEKEMARSRIDTLLLSFGQWDATGNIQISDGMASIPTDMDWIPLSYLTWTQFKFDNSKNKVMVAFGGQTYESIWGYLTTPENREHIAQSLANLLTQNYPVFKRGDGGGQYQQVGTVQLDGIDFDFEKAARVTPEENANLLDLAKRLRQKVAAIPGKKLISLTTYHVGADPVECASPAVTQDCSYIEPARSSHHGEVLPILQGGRDVFDFFNVMAYDAGPRFKYDVAMNNYARTIGNPSKVVLGATINSQWGPEKNFVEDYHNNIERADWQARQNYGGFFVWALGSNTEQMPFAEQINYLNDMKDAADKAAGNEDVENPTAPTELKATVQDKTISLSWKPATDNVGVASYQVYRNGSNYHSTISTNWNDPAALPNVEYRYSVKARDAAGNLSDASNEVTAKIEQSEENNDQAFINALTMSMQSTDNSDSVTFSGTVTSSSAATSTPGYQWTLPAGALGGSNGLAQQQFTVNKTGQVQNLKVKVKVTAGKETRELERDITVPAQTETGQYPLYKPGFGYKAGDIVKNKNGDLFECKPWPYSGWCGSTSAQHYEPGIGLNWSDAWNRYSK